MRRIPVAPRPSGLSAPGRRRIAAVLEDSEAEFASPNHKALAQVLRTDPGPENPVYQAVVTVLAQERGVRLPRYAGFESLAERDLSDMELVFAAVVAAATVDRLRHDTTYFLRTDGGDLRARINRVLEEEGFTHRITATAIQPVGGPPATMDAKLPDLRAERQLEHDFANAVAQFGRVGVLFLDIDHFKALNTRLTESVVDDQVLRPLQRYLLLEVAGRGCAYHVGGDEFIILLHNVLLSEAFPYAERLCADARSWTFADPSGSPISVTLSVGVAVYPDHGKDLQTVRRAANLAENGAKLDGRDRARAASTVSN